MYERMLCMILLDGVLGLSGTILIELLITFQITLRLVSSDGPMQRVVGASVYAYPFLWRLTFESASRIPVVYGYSKSGTACRGRT